MIDALIARKIFGQAGSHTSKAGKSFTVCKVRVPTTGVSPELLAALNGAIALLDKQSTPGSELTKVVAAAQTAVVATRQKSVDETDTTR